MIRIQKSSGSEKLQELRSRIADNSRALIDLFRERADLAREIGEVKRELGLPSRIREREESVLNGLGAMDTFSRSIISSLFEFSILNEDRNHRSASRVKLEDQLFSVSGSREELEILAGLLISRPGVDVYSELELPTSMEQGIQVNGGHVIMGEHDSPDITVCLDGNNDGCDFSLTDENELKFRLKFPVKSGDVIVKVTQ